MERGITRKNVGFFGVLYANYLEKYHPDAWKQFLRREDHLDLLRKYHVYCQRHMAIIMDMLKAENLLKSRRDYTPGFQQDLYQALMTYIEQTIFDELIDLLREADWTT